MAYLDIEVENCDYVIDKYYRLYTRAVIRQQSCSVRVESMLLKNGAPLTVQNRKPRLMLMRYLSKLNTTIRDGFFRVHHVTGVITFCMESLFSIPQFWELMCRHKQCLHLVESETLLNMRLLKFNIYKILFLVDEIDEEYLNFMSSQGAVFRRTKTDFQTIDLIKNCLIFSH